MFSFIAWSFQVTTTWDSVYQVTPCGIVSSYMIIKFQLQFTTICIDVQTRNQYLKPHPDYLAWIGFLNPHTPSTDLLEGLHLSPKRQSNLLPNQDLYLQQCALCSINTQPSKNATWLHTEAYSWAPCKDPAVVTYPSVEGKRLRPWPLQLWEPRGSWLQLMLL